MLPEVTIPESVLRRSYAFERLAAPAAVLDASGAVVETNEAWRLFATLNEAIPETTGPGANYLAVCDRAHASGAESAGAVAAGLRSILRGERGSFELEYPCPSPIEDRWFRLHASAAPVADGGGVVLFHVNVTARVLLEERLADDAGRDPSTGLPNRHTAIRLIEDAVAIAAIVDERLTIMHLRIGGLDAVSKELGPPAAEELLVQVTARARRAVRADDHFCRVGTNELVVVCPDLDDAAAAAIVARLHTAIAAPFQLGADAVSASVVIGVAAAESDSTADALLATASDAGIHDVAPPARADRRAGMGVDFERRGEAVAAAISAAHAQAQRDAVVAHSSELVMYFEADGAIAWASPATRTLFGVDNESIIGRSGFDFIHPDDRERVLGQLVMVGGLGETVECEFRIVGDDGEIHWVEETVTNLIDDPQVGYVVCNMHNITARKRDEEAIRLQGRLLDAAGQAIIAVDMTGKVFYWNAAATDTYGWTAEEASGRLLTDMLSPAVGWDDEADLVRDHVLAGEQWSGDFLTRRKDGSSIPVFVTDTPVYDDAGTQIGIIAVSTDITERKRLELDVWQLATHDPLTGLPNRNHLLEQLDTMLAETGACVLLFDVDRFKLINDSLGHDRGDEVLVAIADALRATLVPPEIAARFDSDAFAVIAPGVTSSVEARSLVGRVRARLADGLAAGAEPHLPTVSLGIVVAKSGDTAITALREAETAMYRAKENGRDRAEWFDPSLHRDVVASYEVERDLRHAITHNELFLEFQPVLDLHTGETTSCEALVRWRHPARGLLRPDEFIPVAESTGLIVGLGRWLLPFALSIATDWPDAVCIAVNLSSRELAEPDLVAFVKQTLTELGVEASRLIFEITETAVITDATAAARTISALRALGVSVVIDDFGTGYTSLSFLRDYQIDGLKIDRSFVTQLGHGSTAIVDAMIRMSAALGLTVVAEGIETEEELQDLRALGCRFIQGYLFSRPVAPELLSFELSTLGGSVQ